MDLRGPASPLKQQSTCQHQQSICIPSRSLLHSAIQAQNKHQLQEQTYQCLEQHKQDNVLISRRQGLALLSVGVASTQLLQLASFCKEAPAAVVDEDVATKVYAACRASVVSVVNYKGQSDVQTGVGSGFVWDQYGHIVTNYHVISKLDKSSDVTKVVLPNGNGSGSTSLPARLVAVDTMSDIAVLQVDNTEAFQPVMIGSSADLKIGQAVYAVGAPYGLSSTMSVGVVSGLNRSIPSPVGTRIYGAIQTDVSINAGNSGGPLLDSSARVIGINTATFTKSGTGRGSGVNFALPMDKVREIVPNLILFGNASGKRI